MNSSFSIEHAFILLIFLLMSYTISRGLIPIVIKLVHKFDLMDIPDHRKQHKQPTPSMGGLAIIASMLIGFILCLFFMDNVEWLFIIVSIFSFSLMGFVDDWKDLNAKLKLLVQIGLSISAYFLGFKLDYGFGLFGIYEIAAPISFILTVGIYILLINAYNLIDGIDELAGGLLSINAIIFVVVFFELEQYAYATLSVITFGAVRGFLKFNAHPAKIFMGDSGSLPLGMLMALFTFKTLQFIKMDSGVHASVDWIFPAVVALNSIPLFDTLRVFTIRILKGRSPFSADRIHLHHLFLKNKLGHKKSAQFIHLSHAVIIAVVIFFSPSMYLWVSVLVICGLAVVAFEINTLFRIRNQSNEKKRLIKEEEQFIKSNRLLITIKK